MKIKEIIDGLRFTVDMFLFDPETGEVYTEPRNDLDKITIDACNAAIRLLDQIPEGHGNLIDVNDLLLQVGLEDTQGSRDFNVGEIITMEDIDRIPVIIKRDEEEKDEGIY